ncbi:DMT family transporter [Edwardsiella ictaluri]|uniref:DMT family transporter n=1 Tax=Edwardsiella ictaluri TaxID=67780 RepID=UPI0021D9C4D6|nr:DMT family transporter [Edwardsiella ictaluri]UYB61980.1 DMT family transporter [Edwardsiella ictaluri]UYB65205.1 DMT family transporter [Edwardsiella ictaluri]WJH19924.1 DMT family transporter [Edwardsiella ictaluri]BEH97546.1 DMT family transporter [Edwardsiella ictaluri]BEI01013.1 DMT family transporter [Edwardsiella ictaluri]
MESVDSKNGSRFGVGYILVFNLLSGIQAVYLSGLLQKANLFATITITFFFVSIFFLGVSFFYKDKKITPTAPAAKFYNILAINLTTAGSWLGFFVALKYIEPAVVSALANAIGPMLTLFITVKITKSDKLTRAEIFSVIGVFVCMSLMIHSTMNGASALGNTSRNYAIIGIVMAFLCGISMVLNTIFSKRLNNQGVKPHSIMTFRFVLIVLVGIYIAGYNEIMVTLHQYWLTLLIVALFGNIIPLYILQVGISKVPPLVVSFALVLAPLFYFLSQQFSKRISFSVETFIYIICSLLFLSYGIYIKSKGKIVS